MIDEPESAPPESASPETAPEAPLHEDTEVDSYEAMQAEVDKHFEGSWERFLKAVENAKEVLHFVLTHHCGTNPTKFEAWATEKQLPPGWIQRFYMTLTPEGQLKE